MNHSKLDLYMSKKSAFDTELTELWDSLAGEKDERSLAVLAAEENMCFLNPLTGETSKVSWYNREEEMIAVLRVGCRPFLLMPDNLKGLYLCERVSEEQYTKLVADDASTKAIAEKYS